MVRSLCDLGFIATKRADAFDIELNHFGLKALGQNGNAWRDIVQAIDFATFRALEMRMPVTGAKDIWLKAPRTVVASDLVYDVIA